MTQQDQEDKAIATDDMTDDCWELHVCSERDMEATSTLVASAANMVATNQILQEESHWLKQKSQWFEQQVQRIEHAAGVGNWHDEYAATVA